MLQFFYIYIFLKCINILEKCIILISCVRNKVLLTYLITYLLTYLLTYSTKILSLTTARFLLILVDTLSVFELPMVPGVYINFTVPPEEEVHSFSWGHRYTHSAVQSWKTLETLVWHYIRYYSKVIVELEKIQTSNLTVFMVPVIWPTSTLKFLFVFDFN